MSQSSTLATAQQELNIHNDLKKETISTIHIWKVFVFITLIKFRIDTALYF